ATVFYVLVYLFSNLAAFGVISAIENQSKGDTRISAFNGLYNTSTNCPCSAAAMKIKNLLKNPAKKGMPPKENTATIITNASFGLVLYSPLNAEMRVSPLDW
ncbi:NAD(P)H-quinone oxidoreductase subunit 2, partial [termite gut metagenome]